MIQRNRVKSATVSHRYSGSPERHGFTPLFTLFGDVASQHRFLSIYSPTVTVHAGCSSPTPNKGQISQVLDNKRGREY